MFWMVIRMEGKGGTRWRHPSREAAVAEARRLAQEEQVEFGVLGVVEVLTPDPEAPGFCAGCGRTVADSTAPSVAQEGDAGVEAVSRG